MEDSNMLPQVTIWEEESCAPASWNPCHLKSNKSKPSVMDIGQIKKMQCCGHNLTDQNRHSVLAYIWHKTHMLLLTCIWHQKGHSIMDTHLTDKNTHCIWHTSDRSEKTQCCGHASDGSLVPTLLQKAPEGQSSRGQEIKGPDAYITGRGAGGGGATPGQQGGQAGQGGEGQKGREEGQRPQQGKGQARPRRSWGWGECCIHIIITPTQLGTSTYGRQRWEVCLFGVLSTMDIWWEMCCCLSSCLLAAGVRMLSFFHRLSNNVGESCCLSKCLLKSGYKIRKVPICWPFRAIKRCLVLRL